MAQIEIKPAAEVKVGRSRVREALLKPFIDALEPKTALAGIVRLDKDERPERVRDLLRAAARIHGKRVRTTYEDGERIIYWKCFGAKA